MKFPDERHGNVFDTFNFRPLELGPELQQALANRENENRWVSKFKRWWQGCLCGFVVGFIIGGLLIGWIFYK